MEAWIIGIIGLLVGVIGIGIGAFIGIMIKKTDRILSFFLGLSGGFMMFIVSFHLLPEAFYLAGSFVVILGVALGIILIIGIEKILSLFSHFPSMTKTGILLGLSIGVHNLPEGLALGSSLVGLSDFALVLTFAMLIHNIPEGISMSIPLSMNKVKAWRILLFSMLVALPTGVGAYLGAYLGNISNTLVSLCLSIAGGTMLYIVADEIIPTGKTLHKGRVSSIAVVIGFSLGIILYF